MNYQYLVSNNIFTSNLRLKYYNEFCTKLKLTKKEFQLYSIGIFLTEILNNKYVFNLNNREIETKHFLNNIINNQIVLNFTTKYAIILSNVTNELVLSIFKYFSGPNLFWFIYLSEPIEQALIELNLNPNIFVEYKKNEEKISPHNFVKYNMFENKIGIFIGEKNSELFHINFNHILKIDKNKSSDIYLETSISGVPLFSNFLK